MYGKMKDHLSKTLAEIKEAGLYKEERLIESAQQAAISVKGKEVLNFCANNYLGLSNHPRLIAAAQQIMERRGYGMSSVRFICGTQDIHKELEAAISDYFKTEDTILYAACFDANGECSSRKKRVCLVSRKANDQQHNRRQQHQRKLPEQHPASSLSKRRNR